MSLKTFWGNFYEKAIQRIDRTVGITGHHRYWLHRPFASVYSYDPADDGPECDVITKVLAAHPLYVPGRENGEIVYSRLLERTALILFQMSFDKITEIQRCAIKKQICQYEEAS